jgi:hypothetical protein
MAFRHGASPYSSMKALTATAFLEKLLMIESRNSRIFNLPASLRWGTLFVLAACGTAYTGAARADDFSDALTKGTTTLEVRPRYESVDQTGKQDAEAFTVRTMLGYTTAPLDGFSASVQLIDVAHAGDAYNSLRNGETKYANILDPSGANINQAFVSYARLPHTTIKAGRQIIILDDARFVGNVNFRQNMQTFDAATIENGSIPYTTLHASYIWGIKNILNEYVPTQTYLAEGSVARFKFLKIDGFGYWYGNDAAIAIPGAAACALVGIRACNSATYGVRVSGTVSLPATIKLSYEGTYASQHPYDGGITLIYADYWHAGAKITFAPVSLGLDEMVMGSNSNGTYGFQTPLATKHAFNGWAETFLTTPAKGLNSKYVTLGIAPERLTLQASYYDYHSDYQGLHYGSEWDLSAGYPLTSYLKATVEYADYHADGFGLTTKAAWGYLALKLP